MTGSLKQKRLHESEENRFFISLSFLEKRRLKIEEKHVKGIVEQERIEEYVESEGLCTKSH